LPSDCKAEPKTKQRSQIKKIDAKQKTKPRSKKQGSKKKFRAAKYSAFLKGEGGAGGRGNLFSREKRFPLPPASYLHHTKKALHGAGRKTVKISQ